MTYETNPSLEDAVVRSRQLPDKSLLDPPADFPVLFSCKYSGQPSIGCVYRNGAVVILHDRMQHGGICVFNNMRAVDESESVTAIVWEWMVARLVEPPPPVAPALKIAE